MSDCSKFDCSNNQCKPNTICREPVFDVTNIMLTLGVTLAVAVIPRRAWVLTIFSSAIYIFFVWYSATAPCRSIETDTPTYLSTVTNAVTRNGGAAYWHPSVAKKSTW